MAKPGPPIVWWMDAQNYSKLSKEDKLLVSTEIKAYEDKESLARKEMTDAIADIVNKYGNTF